jgi:hypothetical protein
LSKEEEKRESQGPGQRITNGNQTQLPSCFLAFRAEKILSFDVDTELLQIEVPYIMLLLLLKYRVTHSHCGQMSLNA